jgi:AraC family transcriptional regulator, regulatory protein of adaptative response / DNA-3-methyladenine glycosylase II
MTSDEAGRSPSDTEASGPAIAVAGPFDPVAVFEFLSRRAVSGIETVESGHYRRTLRLRDATGTIWLSAGADRQLHVAVSGGLTKDDAVARVRWMLDLDADADAIAAHLAADPGMAPLAAAHPAMRVFRGPDPFEVAIRSIIGQQVSVARARVLNGVLVERCGEPIVTGEALLTRLFPTPAQVLDGDLGRLGMPGARVTALRAVAAAALEDPELFARRGSVEETTARLRAVKGIGDWTAHYIAMRACGEPDAFPASDVGLLRGAAVLFGRRPSPRELLARAEAWRPWRAYAAHHLWAVDSR